MQEQSVEDKLLLLKKFLQKKIDRGLFDAFTIRYDKIYTSLRIIIKLLGNYSNTGDIDPYEKLRKSLTTQIKTYFNFNVDRIYIMDTDKMYSNYICTLPRRSYFIFLDDTQQVGNMKSNEHKNI